MSTPNRGHILTEQRNDRSASIDTLSVEGCLRTINDDDQLIAEAVRDAIPSITAFVTGLVPRVERGGRLIYIGAGTSGRLGVLDASECPPTFQSDPSTVIGIIAGGDAALRVSSEGREDERAGAHDALSALRLTEHDALLGIATGGTTPYVHGAIEYALRHNTLTGFLTCAAVVPDPAPDHLIRVLTGAEIVTGSTRMKAGTATKLVLNMISTTLMIQLGKVYGNLMVDLRASNDKLRDRAARILVEICDIDRDTAFGLLDRADGHVKTAAVMHAHDISADDAASMLARHHGRLRPCLEQASNA